MALNKDQLKQMLDKNKISYDEEMTVAQMEKLLMNNSGKINDENSNDDNEPQNTPDPDADEKANDDEAKKDEEIFNPQSPVQEREDGPPIPIGRETGGTARDGEVAPVQDITKLYNEDAQNMKAHLAKQRKVRFAIPITEGEKEGAYDTWCGNGYKLTIKKGIMVDLPEQVANDLANHYNINMNMNVGREKRIAGNAGKEAALR